MSVQYVRLPASISRDRELVSKVWSVVLHDMYADGVRANVNEGKRTMDRQWGFWNDYQAGRGPIAAYPSISAPHIREGRFDHAVDFANDWAAFAWLEEKGLQPSRPVRWPNGTVRESWHIECPAGLLLRYYRERTQPLSVLGPKRRRAADTLLKRRRNLRAAEKAGKRVKARLLKPGVRRSIRKVRRLRNRARAGAQRRVLTRVLNARNGRL
jgi:hypothetical protein